MGAGQLRRRVTFQREISTPDGGGGETLAWGEDVTVWGRLMTERGLERVQAGRLQSSLGAVLRVRSSSLTRVVEPSHSVLIGGERYQIRSIANPDQRGKFLEMTLEKGVAQ